MPANLAAQVVSSTQINLSWNLSADNVGVAGYKIYRDGTFLKKLDGYADPGFGSHPRHDLQLRR